MFERPPKFTVKNTILVVLSTAASYALSGIASYMGLDPAGALARVFGDETLKSWAALVNDIVTSQFLRWGFVFVGNASFALGTIILLFIPMMRLYAANQALRRDFEDESIRLNQKAERLEKLHRVAIQKERSARNLHNQTRKMLEKMGLHKRGPKGLPAESPQVPKPPDTPAGT
jgi:hypothetical protein